MSEPGAMAAGIDSDEKMAVIKRNGPGGKFLATNPWATLCLLILVTAPMFGQVADADGPQPADCPSKLEQQISVHKIKQKVLYRPTDLGGGHSNTQRLFTKYDTEKKVEIKNTNERAH